MGLHVQQVGQGRGEDRDEVPGLGGLVPGQLLYGVTRVLAGPVEHEDHRIRVLVGLVATGDVDDEAAHLRVR